MNSKEFKEFNELYNKAIKEGKDKFTFQDKQAMIPYAKYLIKYLEPRFKAKEKL